MRTNQSNWTRSLWSVVVALAAIGLAASDAAAQSAVHLIAAPVTKAVTLPNGTVVSVPMWGYAVDADDSGTVNGSEVVTVPGPRIVVPVGASTLAVTLTNLLPEPTSLIVPGQPFAASPERNPDGRVRSMTTDTPAGSTGIYTFTGLKPGTFLYQSGSHPAVQLQMGLYGAMTKDESAGNAYAGIAYAHGAVLVYSEIDLALHQAVADGTYGTPAGPTSTIDYKPSLFLINGESYTTESMATIAAGTVGETTLLRILNAGLRTHAPVLDNGSLTIVAEDGNPLPFAKDQAAMLLAAGKTHDALWTPSASGVYSLYDRTLSLNAPGQGSAGMLAKLRIEAAVAPAAGDPVAVNDAVSGLEDGSPITGAVLSNDTDAVSAALVASPRAGVLSFNSNGTFSYTPSPNFFGVDEFTYRAVNAGSVQSAPALVTITVAGAPDAPVANAQTVGVDQDGNVSVTLTAQDPDGDSLKFYLTSQPADGALSYIDPITKVETPIVAADLYPAATKKAIPGGLVIYTPTAAYVGPDAFNFVAFDGSLVSGAAVSATVNAVQNSATAGLTQEVALSVVGADGSPIGSYRWTLEEDLTYKVVPGAADPYTLAVSFHRSYMPVVAVGTEADPVMVDPAKRYFISVLPTVNNYSMSGAGIEAGQTAATVTVANLPLPTARIRVRVFQDNAPLNGMWDSTEPGLQGFQVTIDDAAGTYGMSGGHQSTDAFGNKIGTTYEPCDPGPCDSYQVTQLGDGFVLTDADGYAVIEHLPMGKYTVKVRAPGGDKWVQTTTIEGQLGIDAWVKPNEPQFFTEFGPPGPHVFMGFTRAETGEGLLGVGSGPWSTIKGRVTNLRMSRVPAVAQFSGAPFTHTRAWVALNSGATGGSLLYTQPTNEDGTFSIAGVPSGSYQLMVFDSALDLIIGSVVINVNGAASETNVGDVGVFPWFTNLYSFVFDDKNGDGIHDAGEPGIPDQALNIRFRDGSIYQSLSTGENGFKAFNEVFPFFAWMVAEVDYARNHSTGVTVVVDNGGDATTTCATSDWRTAAGFPTDLGVPCNILNPQPQPDQGGAPFRTESGAETPFLLLEGFQGFIGQSSVMMWGKAPYAAPGSFVEDVNVAPFDDFPNVAGGDVDANGDGYFNTDRSNGGIAGIVHYTITRAEGDPRWATAENWEPGVSDVTIQLWDATRTHLLNEASTDNWNNSLPTGCQWDQPFSYQGNAISARGGCFDGLRVFNQARPALFDGGYAFSTILQDAVDSPTYDLPVDQRGVARPLPAGKYVVKMIPPPGYKVQKEEDKNVDFGDQYIPQQFWLTGYALADAAASPLASLGGPVSASQTTITLAAGGGTSVHPNDVINVDAEVMRVTAAVGDTLAVLRAQANSTADAHAAGTDVYSHDAPPAPTVSDNALWAPFCVGSLHTVPDELSLFPGVPSAFGGEQRPLCDAKLVVLRDGQQAAPDFHLLTDAPKAGQIYGMVLDDTTNEFDPNAPTFGEKYAPPFIGVAIKDWQGRELTRTYTDQYGMYNALVPSTYTIQVPQPSGVSPSILSACINPPMLPNGTLDPHFQKQYSHFCYPLQYLPGKTTYLDTPVVPTGAFTGNGTFPVDAEFPDKTPVIALVTGPTPVANPGAPNPATPYGPYIVDRGAADNAARTIAITSAASMTTDGLTEVANPAYDGAVATQPKLIKRDYGFGTLGGTVLLGGQPIPSGNVTWGNTQITAIVPAGARTGELSVLRNVSLPACTPYTTPLSTLAAPIDASVGSLIVAIGDGKKFALNTEIQIGTEVMLVTGGNRSTLASAMGTGAAIAGTTLRVPDGQGTTFATLPANVSVDSEVITLNTKSTTAVRLAMTAAATTLAVTNGTGGSRFDTDDFITVGTGAGLEVMKVLSATANTLTVQRAVPGLPHGIGQAVVANDRFMVALPRVNPASHAVGAPVIGDRLYVALPRVNAAPHGLNSPVSSYTTICAPGDTRKSTLGVTLSVATPQMHTDRPPTVVATGPAIQAAIDAARPGDLILVKPGEYQQMVVMTKPVRLQGAGALSTLINVVTTPAESIQAWLDKVGNLLLSTPAYTLPNQPAMTPAPFQSGDVAAVLGDEGPGVLVLSKNADIDQDTGRCQGSFATPQNEAYCLHNENSEWQPNARIDGLSLIGASNAPGVLVNGHAHYLEISNNRITTNSGTYAGGIKIGHAGAALPFGDQNAQNNNVAIHNNMIVQNAGIDNGGGGGVVLSTGSNGYVVKDNFIAANFTAGNGAGISHIGRSPGGTIDANAVIFNESFLQATGTNGGGIFIGGTPVAAGAVTNGSGTVDVTNNLIQGNGATGGDGGGIALQRFSGNDHVRLFNNVIANNVAGLAGGGISIADTAAAGGSANNPTVDIVHNTIVHNDSTGTAGAAFTAGPLTSVAQPGGIVFRGDISTPDVRIANSIVWQNRTFTFGECLVDSPCGPEAHPIYGPPGTVFGEKLVPGQDYWDLGVLGGTGQFNLESSVLTALTGQPGGADYSGGSAAKQNVTTAPAFVAFYFNTDRRQAYQMGETNGEGTLISVPAALDEGGNFIRPQFGPLSMENPAASPNPFFGNYHVTIGVGGQTLWAATGGGNTVFGNDILNVPLALWTDFDQQARPNATPDRGADQVVLPAPTTPVPKR